MLGSTCVNKFLNLKGYEEQKSLIELDKKHRQLLVQNGKVCGRSEYIDMFFDAEKYFLSLPILLPYELYDALSEIVEKLKDICSDSHKIVTEFEHIWNEFQKLKSQADLFVKNNISEPLICRKREIDWMIANNNIQLLKTISKNNSIYTKDTIGDIYSDNFIHENLKKIMKANNDNFIKFGECSPISIIVLFDNSKYFNQISFQLPLKTLMKTVGCNCVLYDNFKYNSSEILSQSIIMDTQTNMDSIIKYITEVLGDLYYNGSYFNFLYDYSPNKVIIHRKNDGAIVNIKDTNKFLITYSKIIALSDEKIKEALLQIISSVQKNQWILADRDE